jgi:hypothetical protein
VVQFGFFHPPLAIQVGKEFQRSVERLLWIVDHISKCSPLMIVKKIVPRDANSRHVSVSFEKSLVQLQFLHARLL